jgi:phosphoribosylformylglycinamidine synthase
MPQAPQSAVLPLSFEGGNALSAFRAQALLPQLQAVCDRITGVAARHVHWVLPEPGQALDAGQAGRPAALWRRLHRH